MALPSLDHLTFEDFRNIYEPSDDTFLLVDALDQDRQRICGLNPCVCVEVGSGAGAVITFLGQMLRNADVPSQLIAIDVNPLALEATKQTARVNEIHGLEAIQSDLLTAVLPRLENQVDILIFNPPYVPTDDSEVSMGGIEASYAGGRRGRRVIDRFMPLMHRALSINGSCYMVVVEENRPQEIMTSARERGVTAEIVISRRAKNEGLSIIRFCRSE